MPPSQKKPSGAEFRKRRQLQQAAERAAQAERAGSEPSGKLSSPACADTATAHLWTLGILTDQLAAIQQDTAIESEEARWKMVNETARAIGMLQVKADLERRVKDLEARLNAALDEVAARRAELERSARKEPS